MKNNTIEVKNAHSCLLKCFNESGKRDPEIYHIIGMTRQRFNRIVNNKTIPTFSELCDFASCISITQDDLTEILYGFGYSMGNSKENTSFIAQTIASLY